MNAGLCGGIRSCPKQWEHFSSDYVLNTTLLLKRGSDFSLKTLIKRAQVNTGLPCAQIQCSFDGLTGCRLELVIRDEKLFFTARLVFSLCHGAPRRRRPGQMWKGPIPNIFRVEAGTSTMFGRFFSCRAVLPCHNPGSG